MYAIVVGCGRMGFNLVWALIEQQHEVAVIERDPERCGFANEQFGHVAMVGDGCEPSALHEVGTERADVFIALTGKDEDNLVACQLAKHRFLVPKTIALVNNPRNEELFRILGIDVQIGSTAIILQHIEEEIPETGVVHIEAPRASNWELVSIKIPPDAACVGKPVNELRMPEGSVVSMVVQMNGQAHFPQENVILHAGDQILVVTNPASEELIMETLTGVE